MREVGATPSIGAMTILAIGLITQGGVVGVIGVLVVFQVTSQTTIDDSRM